MATLFQSVGGEEVFAKLVAAPSENLFAKKHPSCIPKALVDVILRSQIITAANCRKSLLF